MSTWPGCSHWTEQLYQVIGRIVQMSAGSEGNKSFSFSLSYTSKLQGFSQITPFPLMKNMFHTNGDVTWEQSDFTGPTMNIRR